MYIIIYSGTKNLKIIDIVIFTLYYIEGSLSVAKNNLAKLVNDHYFAKVSPTKFFHQYS